MTSIISKYQCDVTWLGTSIGCVGVPNGAHAIYRPVSKIIEVVPCRVISDVISQECLP